ncbi:fasciclin domain-containing protein [Paraflavisolibacter sp. H34]|uniref:fasciclin domain-containing protein n=1 Tax=Huijunlia imazamoxiresistens TaxID=3127457 RepID=UPI00301A7A24
MIQYIRGTFLFLALGLLMTNCRKKAFDEFYGRPENLAPPIYQQLESMGRFKNLLSAIDKSGYKDILSAAGNWTLFAPNDSAFGVYLKDKGVATAADLDSNACRQLVTYCLVYNNFDQNYLADYQSNTGWVPGAAYKRRTAYYEGFYTDSLNTNGGKALSANRNGSFVLGDNNNKYIPFFVEEFMQSKGLTARDYNYFFPNTPYTKFNVVDAGVLKADIPAENGYIHEINKVVTPLASLDKYLASKPEYSLFKKLFDKYLVAFIENAPATARYKLLTGQADKVSIKTYSGALAFSPNNENFLKQQDNDGQANGWTLLVPNNEVLKKYLGDVILEKFGSAGLSGDQKLDQGVLDQVPLQVIVDLVNAHMAQTSIWPSKFTTLNNFQGELPTMDAYQDVADRQMLSNGLFYGTTAVQQANVFRTVYGKPYLNPAYLLMTKALDANWRYSITVPNIKYTLLMMPDPVMRANGFDFNYQANLWKQKEPGATAYDSSAAGAKLQRVLATHILKGDVDVAGGSGIVETIGGEYVRYDHGVVWSHGTKAMRVVPYSSSKDPVNGRAYASTDSVLWYSNNAIGLYLQSLADANKQFTPFYQYLRNSSLFSGNNVTGVTQGVFYTFLVPDSVAMQRAVDKDLLPYTVSGTKRVFKYNPDNQNDKTLVENFIKYHIINKNAVVPDGQKTGSFSTLYLKNNGDASNLFISSPANLTNNILNGQMQVRDDFGKTVNLRIAGSNNLADRIVIHLLDDYLEYNPN